MQQFLPLANAPPEAEALGDLKRRDRGEESRAPCFELWKLEIAGAETYTPLQNRAAWGLPAPECWKSTKSGSLLLNRIDANVSAVLLSGQRTAVGRVSHKWQKSAEPLK